MIGAALLDLADTANCIKGDMHFMHLNYKGCEFDVLHAVLKKYYEEAAEDFDTWSEAALMCEDVEQTQSPNCSAARLKWQCMDSKVDCDIAVARIDELLDTYLAALLIVYVVCEKNKTCHVSIGIANTLQTRIEYWSKELKYFNNRRKASGNIH